MYDSRKFGVRNAVATMPRMVDFGLGWKRTEPRGDWTMRREVRDVVGPVVADDRELAADLHLVVHEEPGVVLELVLDQVRPLRPASGGTPRRRAGRARCPAPVSKFAMYWASASTTFVL